MFKYIISILALTYIAILLSFNLYSDHIIWFIDPITVFKGIMYHRGIRGWLLFYTMLFVVFVVIYIAYKAVYNRVEAEFNAPIKIKAEEIKALYKTNFGNIDNDAFKTKTYYVTLNFKKERTGVVIRDLLQKYSSYIPVQKFQIIEKLIDIIEEYGDIPSVASYFGIKNDNKDIDDKEFSYKGYIITEDGLTSYDILKTVTLYNHTLNVLEEILKIVQIDNPKNFELLVADVAIVALAHDIGKIRNFNVTTPFEIDGETIIKEFKLSGELLNKYNHNLLSGIIFRNLWPILEDSSSNTLEMSKNSQEKIVEAIVGHHDTKGSTNNLLKYIIEADKNARKEEIRQFQIDRIKNIGNSSFLQSDFQKVQDIVRDNSNSIMDTVNSSEEEGRGGIPKRASEKLKEKQDIKVPSTIIIPENQKQDMLFNNNSIDEDSSDDLLGLSNLSNINILESNKDIKKKSTKEEKDKKKEDKAVETYIKKEVKEEEDRTIIPIKFNIEEDNLVNFMAELNSNINRIANREKIKSLISVSDGDTVYFAITFIKKLIVKHFWSDCTNDEQRGAAKYLIQFLYDQGLTNNMVRANGMACMSVNGNLGNLKKFFCLPLDAKVAFGLSKEELLQSKANSSVKDLAINFYKE